MFLLVQNIIYSNFSCVSVAELVELIFLSSVLMSRKTLVCASSLAFTPNIAKGSSVHKISKKIKNKAPNEPIDKSKSAIINSLLFNYCILNDPHSVFFRSLNK